MEQRQIIKTLFWALRQVRVGVPLDDVQGYLMGNFGAVQLRGSCLPINEAMQNKDREKYTDALITLIEQQIEE